MLRSPVQSLDLASLPENYGPTDELSKEGQYSELVLLEMQVVKTILLDYGKDPI